MRARQNTSNVYTAFHIVFWRSAGFQRTQLLSIDSSLTRVPSTATPKVGG
jgi:hypothetical protein